MPLWPPTVHHHSLPFFSTCYCLQIVFCFHQRFYWCMQATSQAVNNNLKASGTNTTNARHTLMKMWLAFDSRINFKLLNNQKNGGEVDILELNFRISLRKLINFTLNAELQFSCVLINSDFLQQL